MWCRDQTVPQGSLQLQAQILERRSLDRTVHRGFWDGAVCQHRMCHRESSGFKAQNRSLNRGEKHKCSALKKEIRCLLFEPKIGKKVV